MPPPDGPIFATIEPIKRPTILDVARACGVAKSTVSVVLNSSPAAERVPEETRQRVRSIATQLGYRASWRARALAARKTHMVGVVYSPPMPLIARGNYEGILAGINSVLSASDYHLLLMPLTGENPAEWRRMLLDGRIDGAIVLSRLVPQLAEIILGSGMPVTLVNADSDRDVPKVLADEYGGAAETVRYLLGLGHRRITFLLGQQPPHYSVTQRIAGYRDALSTAGLADAARVYDNGLDEFVEEWIAAPRDRRATAVVCYTHYLAIKLLQKLWERDLRVPDDLSVTCFSNAYPVEDVIPPLTTVALATDQMGRTAAEMVLEQIVSKGAAPKRSAVLRTRLIVRGSTAAPAARPEVS